MKKLLSLLFLFSVTMSVLTAQKTRRDSIMDYSRINYKNAAVNGITRDKQYEFHRINADYSELIEANAAKNTVIDIYTTLFDTGNTPYAGKFVRENGGTTITCFIDKSGVKHVINKKFSTGVATTVNTVSANDANSDYRGTFVKEQNATYITAYVDPSGVRHQVGLSPTALSDETAARIAADATKANQTALLDSAANLRTSINAINTNVVRLLDAATAYVSPNGDNAIAVIGDEFKPYQTPWDALRAVATAQKNGSIKKATIVVKKGEYTVGLTGSGATYMQAYLNNNTFSIDTIPYYAASPNSTSLVYNNVTWEFRDGVQLGAKAGNLSCFVKTNRPDTCSFVGVGTGAWFKETTYNQNTSSQNDYMSIGNDSAQIAVILPNSSYINSFGWNGWNLRGSVNLAFDKVFVNRSRGIALRSERFTANSKPVIFRLKTPFWTDSSGKYIANWPTNFAPNECSIFQSAKLAGADVKIDVGTAEISSPAVYVRGGSSQYGANALACDTNIVIVNIDNIYQYRQFSKNPSHVFHFCDSLVKSDVIVNIKKGITEGGFVNTNFWTGIQLKDSKVKFDCESCRYQPSKYVSDNTRPAFALIGTSTDTISTIRITGNYVIDSAQVFVITGSAPLNIIVKGNFISRSGRPIFEVNNVNARIIVESGSSLVTNGANVVTGTSGAKIYFQSGVDYTGAISTVQLLTTKPTTWYF